MQSLSPCNCRELAAARPTVQRPQRLVCRAAVREVQQQQQRQQLTSLPLLVAGLAAAALVGAGDAEAKVKFQQPDKPARQLFQKDPNAIKLPKPDLPGKESSGGGFKLPSFSAPSFSAPSLPAGPKEIAGGLDARTVALPGAVVGIVGLGFGLTKLDPGFGKVLQETVIKDSGDFAGYEEVLKSGADAIGKSAGVRLGGGTKRMKAKPAAKKQKGGKSEGGGLLSGLLGKK